MAFPFLTHPSSSFLKFDHRPTTATTVFVRRHIFYQKITLFLISQHLQFIDTVKCIYNFLNIVTNSILKTQFILLFFLIDLGLTSLGRRKAKDKKQKLMKETIEIWIINCCLSLIRIHRS